MTRCRPGGGPRRGSWLRRWSGTSDGAGGMATAPNPPSRISIVTMGVDEATGRRGASQKIRERPQSSLAGTAGGPRALDAHSPPWGMRKSCSTPASLQCDKGRPPETAGCERMQGAGRAWRLEAECCSVMVDCIACSSSHMSCKSATYATCPPRHTPQPSSLAASPLRRAAACRLPHASSGKPGPRAGLLAVADSQGPARLAPPANATVQLGNSGRTLMGGFDEGCTEPELEGGAP